MVQQQQQPLVRPYQNEPDKQPSNVFAINIPLYHQFCRYLCTLSIIYRVSICGLCIIYIVCAGTHYNNVDRKLRCVSHLIQDGEEVEDYDGDGVREGEKDSMELLKLTISKMS